MSDQDSEHSSAPPQSQALPGAFDWLVESHRQSAPMAPLSDDVPSPGASTGTFGFSEPAPTPTPIIVPESAFSAPFLPRPTSVPDSVPVAPVFGRQASAPPFAAEPEPPAAPATQLSDAPPPVAASSFPLRFTQTPDEDVAPQPSSPGAATQQQPWTAPPPAGDTASGSGGFGLERRQSRPRSANGPLDWVAFALAILAPPAGLLLGIVAVVTEPRTKGFVTGLAKAAIAVGAVLSVVLGVAFAVYTKVSNDQADHNAIVASSRAWCTSLKSNPAALSSDTFGWPSPADTIPDSITAMKQYVAHWESLVKLAPAGIRSDTRTIATTAQSIVSSVESTQTLDDSSDVAQMQNAVATTGITSWAGNYCG